MDTTLKIQQLWRYLKIQDDEILVVQSYNQVTGMDEFIVTERKDGGLDMYVTNSLQLSTFKKPFRLIQQLDSRGKHIVPTIEQIEHDRLIDY